MRKNMQNVEYFHIHPECLLDGELPRENEISEISVVDAGFSSSRSGRTRMQSVLALCARAARTEENVAAHLIREKWTGRVAAARKERENESELEVNVRVYLSSPSTGSSGALCAICIAWQLRILTCPNVRRDRFLSESPANYAPEKRECTRETGLQIARVFLMRLIKFPHRYPRASALRVGCSSLRQRGWLWWRRGTGKFSS